MVSIAIDGPAGSGKSSVAKIIAKKLGFRHIATGEMYRSLAFILKEIGLEEFGSDKNIDLMNKLLNELKFKVEFDKNNKQVIFVNGRPLREDIKTVEISRLASEISQLAVIRNYLLKIQRELAEKYNVVMDGRDIGTVILPKADVKIFLIASLESRAKRRYIQLKKEGKIASFESILENIKNRDHSDANRNIAPLKKSKDAIEFDNSEINLNQTVDQIITIIGKKLKERDASGIV